MDQSPFIPLLNGRKSKHIKLILFDLGRVLIDFDFAITAKKLSQTCVLDPYKVKSLFQESSLADCWDRGTISGEDFFKRIKNELGLPVTMEGFRTAWNEIFSEKQEMIKFALSLKNNLPGFPWIKNGHKIFILSNTNPWHADYLKKTFMWLNEFDSFIASCDVKLLKPEEKIYRLALDKGGALPSETIYIDDIAENVASAARLGIRSFRFDGYPRLLDVLTKMDLSDKVN